MRELTACTAKSAETSLFISNLSSFLPPKIRKEDSNCLPRGVFNIDFIDQYSLGLKISISISRSTISLRQTDCTLPADFAPGNFLHNTGDRLNPTR